MKGTKHRVLVLGCEGTLGRAFYRHMDSWCADGFCSAGIFLSRTDLDITKRKLLLAEFQDLRPTVVINCAASNLVDGHFAEQHGDCPLWTVNATAPGDLAMLCREFKAKLVHFSTNYVYGRGEGHVESAVPNPWNDYAKSKLIGEERVRFLNADAIILRTSWIFGYPGAEDLRGRLLTTGQCFAASDQKANPTFAGCLVDWTKSLLAKNASGTFNAANSEPVTRRVFVEELAGVVKASPFFKRRSFAVTSGQSMGRPDVCTLDTSKLAKTLGLKKLPSWRDYLREAVFGARAVLRPLRGVKRLMPNQDIRGGSVEIFRLNDSPLPDAKNVFLSWTITGVARGPHQHKLQNEILVFPQGGFRVFLWPNESVCYWADIKEPSSVYVPAGTAHAYRCIDGYSPCICIADRFYKGRSRKMKEDNTRWENRIDSPYRLPDDSPT